MDDKLITIFVAVTALAVMIQTGILVGFYVVTARLNKEANRAVEHAQSLFGPISRLLEVAQRASGAAAEMGVVTHRRRQMHLDVAKAQQSWRNSLSRWS